MYVTPQRARATRNAEDGIEYQSIIPSTPTEALSDSDSEETRPKPCLGKKRRAISESEDDCETIHSNDNTSCKDVPVSKCKIMKTEDYSVPLPDPFPLP